MKKIVITGGAGFVGSNLAKRLSKQKIKLYLIDDLSRGRKEYLKYFGIKDPNLLQVDLRNWQDTKQAFGLIGDKIDTVYHCAARIGGMQFLHGSYEKEYLALTDNLAIDRNVFKACYEHDIKNIIYTSSVSVYNEKEQKSTECLFSEDDLEKQRLNPEKGYGCAILINLKNSIIKEWHKSWCGSYF